MSFRTHASHIGFFIVSTLAVSFLTGCMTIKLNEKISHNTLESRSKRDRHFLRGRVAYNYTISGKRYDLYLVPDPLVKWKGKYIEETAVVIYPSDRTGKALAFTPHSLVKDLLYGGFYQNEINKCIERQGFELHAIVPHTPFEIPFAPIVSEQWEEILKHHESGVPFVWSGRSTEEVMAWVDNLSFTPLSKPGLTSGEQIAVAFLVDEKKNYKAVEVARWVSADSRWNWDPEVPIVDCTAKPLPGFVLGLSYSGYIVTVALDIVTLPLQAIMFGVLTVMGPM